MKLSHRLMATSLAVVAGAGVFAPAAHAQLAGNPAAVNPATIDATAATSLNVHKLLGNADATLPANGTEVNNAPGKPLSGVVFDLYQVEGVDLTTNAGWNAANDLAKLTLTDADVANGYVTGASGTQYTLTKIGSQTTANGLATFANQGVKLVLVDENLAASTAVTDADGKAVPTASITESAPFLVTLPMTDPTSRTGWDYSVDTYPKNQSDTLTKQVLDGNKGTAGQDAYAAGQDLTYRLVSSINNNDTNGDSKVTGADIARYEVADKLPAETTFKSVTVSVLDADGKATVLDPANYTVDNANGTVTVKMTAAGLDVIAAVSGGHVQTDIVATVTAPATGLGEVTNTATFIPSNSWAVTHENNPGIPSNEVISKFGDIVIQKTASDTKAGLAGATFAVYSAGDNDTCEDADVTGTPVATSADSDAQGMTSIKNLQLSNWYNGAEQTQLHNWCLVETKAPAGYQLQAKPVQFSLTVPGSVTDLSAAYADTARDDSATDNTGGNLNVVDTPDNILNHLPQTGGAGMGVAPLAGVGLLVGAAALTAYAAKRKGQEDDAE